MSYERRGSCNRCGECCRAEVIAWFMSDESGYCRYATESAGIYSCVIAGNGFSENPPRKRPPGVSKKEYNWFLAECVPYPIAETTIEKSHPLPEGCGFYFEEVS